MLISNVVDENGKTSGRIGSHQSALFMLNHLFGDGEHEAASHLHVDVRRQNGTSLSDHHATLVILVIYLFPALRQQFVIDTGRTSPFGKLDATGEYHESLLVSWFLNEIEQESKEVRFSGWTVLVTGSIRQLAMLKDCRSEYERKQFLKNKSNDHHATLPRPQRRDGQLTSRFSESTLGVIIGRYLNSVSMRPSFVIFSFVISFKSR